MSPLERRCQLLLRAYPAAYREMRGDEIIGTLLEATPAERSWPLLRDVRGLAFGGLRARAELNRQLTTAANLRTAAFVGIAAYLAFYAADVIGFYLGAELRNGGQHLHPVPVYWPELLASALMLVTVRLAWLTGRRMVVLAGALPAAAAVCIGTWHALGGAVVLLVFLAAIVAMSGNGERPSSRWFVTIGLLAVLLMIVNISTQSATYIPFQVLQLTVVGVSIGWVVIDARPAVAVSLFVLGLWLPNAVGNLTQGYFPLYVWPYLVVTTVIAVPGIWLLRRQSAHPGRSAQIP